MRFIQVGKHVINLDAIARMQITPQSFNKHENDPHLALGIYFAGFGGGCDYDNPGYIELRDDDATALMAHLEWAMPGTWTTLREVS